MSAAKKKARRQMTARALRNTVAVLLLLTAEAALAYLGVTFYLTSFLQTWFKVTLIATDVLFMLGLVWLVNRYILQN